MVAADKRGLVLPLVKWPVSRCIIDFAFSLQLDLDDVTAVVRIGCPFTLVDGEVRQLIDPEGSKELLGPALTLFGHVVTSASASEEGALEIHFDDGRALRVEPDPRYEAWELSGPHGLHAVSRAGGGLVTWQPAAAKR
jgi:hypothetical protein